MIILQRRRLFLIFILLLAFFLRIYKVSENPPALNWDEVSIAYNAYSIMKTGRDEWNQILPLHFKSYGEYKLPVQIYASIPGIMILGLNELGVRITPVIYGTLTVLLAYLLANQIFKNEIFSLTGTLFLAISPWHIHLTRASFESSFSVFWIVLGSLLLIKGLSGNKKLTIWSVLPFVISIYTYNSARVFTPLFLGSILVFYNNILFQMKKITVAASLLFLVLLIPLVPFVLSGEGAARYKLVSIADDAGLIPRINQARGGSKLPQPLPKLIHNKITYLSYYYVDNFFAHFSLDFLFLKGAPHKQHHVQGVGEMYLFQLPLTLIGLYYIFKHKIKYRMLIVIWIILSFVPVAATKDSIPHALRTVIAVLPYQLLSAAGLVLILGKFKNNQKLYLVFIYTMAIIILASLGHYLWLYYHQYPILYSRDWQYGNKQSVNFIKQNYDNYDLIVYTRHFGEPHMFTLFYLQYDPVKFQNSQNLIRYETHDWVRVLQFDKFYFPDLGDGGTAVEDIIRRNKHKRILFVGTPKDFPPEINKLGSVNFLNGDSAFEYAEYNR